MSIASQSGKQYASVSGENKRVRGGSGERSESEQGSRDVRSSPLLGLPNAVSESPKAVSTCVGDVDYGS